MNAYFSTMDDFLENQVGNKFVQLAEINKYTNVPKAICLNNTAFKDSLSSTSWQIIQDNLTLLHSNGGYRLNKIQKEIQEELFKVIFPPSMLEELHRVYQEISDKGKHRLIARSSSRFEDKVNISGAGIYQSFANIDSIDNLIKGILVCWNSAFSLGAIAHRLRINEYNTDPLPGVIIQRYIEAKYSGVTFAQNPIRKMEGIFVEYTTEGSDGIESGTGKFKSFMAVPKPNSKNEYIVSANDMEKKLVDELIITSNKFNIIFKKKMEFEWIIKDSNLYILQARPITTEVSSSSEGSIVKFYKIFDLYLDSEKINRENIGDIKGIYEHSIKKRKPTRIFALQNKIKINGSVVIIANSLGISALKTDSIVELKRLGTPIFTIDLGPHLRSFYCKRKEFSEVLGTLLGYSKQKSAVIVREFASGEFSAVTSPQAVNEVLIEVCRGSLIGINRGFVETDSYLVNIVTMKVKKIKSNISNKSRYYDFNYDHNAFLFENPQTNQPLPTLSDAPFLEMADFTLKVRNKFGNNILEWTIINDEPVYIDNTPLNQKTETVEKYVNDIRFISPGEIRGEVLVISDLDKLEYISSGPTLNIDGHLPTLESNLEIEELLKTVENKHNIIVISKFPYTALSVLIGKVKGFIFESGPVLCHLAIIARENKTPVAIVGDALSRYQTGEIIKL